MTAKRYDTVKQYSRVNDVYWGPNKTISHIKLPFSLRDYIASL